MAYKFNPFTGKLDQVGAGGGGGTPGGSDTQVQFNDGGTFGGDAGLTYNKTTDELTLAGDLNLDDGGSFSTTVQAVTPTANRTISFPDATGTVALVNGANGTIQYNDAGTLNGNSDFTVDPDWNDASTVFTGLKLNVTNTASASASKLLDLQVGGASKLSISNSKIAGTGGYYVTLQGFGQSWLYQLNLTSRLGFGDPFNSDTFLQRDESSGIIAQRNGTNAQTFRLYNTYTDASNYERGFFQWNSNVLEIGSEGLGTGSEQPVRITAATLKLPNLPTYADNAAASAVLAVGDVYKTATGELRIVV
jgi:hypothetical protein